MITKFNALALASLMLGSPLLAAPKNTVLTPAALATKTGIVHWCTENPGKLTLGIAAGGLFLYWLLHEKTQNATQNQSAVKAQANVFAENKGLRLQVASIFQAFQQDPETMYVEKIDTLYSAALQDKRFAQLYAQFRKATTGKMDIAGQIIAYLKSIKN